MTNSPIRIFSKVVLAATVAVSSLTAIAATQAPASAQPYVHHGYGPYRWHGRYYHHRHWHPGYFGPYHRWHAGFWVYF